MRAFDVGRSGHRRVGSCLLALLLAGCASGQWWRDGASAQDVVRDDYECERDVAAMYPPAIVKDELYGSSTQETTDCKRKGDGVRCRTTTTPPMSFRTDANESRRDEAHRSCMRSRGYRWMEGR